jgi:hypothetical protein
MAKKEKVSEPAKKPIVIFYAMFRNYGFQYPKVDKDGNLVFHKNNQGGDITDAVGNKSPVMLNAKFQNIEPSVSRGYLSKFEFNPNDESPQNKVLGERLYKLDEDEGVGVEHEDKFEKNRNPKAFAEKKRAEALEAENSELKGKLDDAEFLQKKLEELTRP